MRDLEESSPCDTGLSTFEEGSHGLRKLTNDCMMTCSQLCHFLAHYGRASMKLFAIFFIPLAWCHGLFLDRIGQPHHCETICHRSKEIAE